VVLFVGPFVCGGSIVPCDLVVGGARNISASQNYKSNRDEILLENFDVSFDHSEMFGHIYCIVLEFLTPMTLKRKVRTTRYLHLYGYVNSARTNVSGPTCIYLWLVYSHRLLVSISQPLADNWGTCVYVCPYENMCTHVRVYMCTCVLTIRQKTQATV